MKLQVLMAIVLMHSQAVASPCVLASSGKQPIDGRLTLRGREYVVRLDGPVTAALTPRGFLVAVGSLEFRRSLDLPVTVTQVKRGISPLVARVAPGATFLQVAARGSKVYGSLADLAPSRDVCQAGRSLASEISFACEDLTLDFPEPVAVAASADAPPSVGLGMLQGVGGRFRMFESLGSKGDALTVASTPTQAVSARLVSQRGRWQEVVVWSPYAELRGWVVADSMQSMTAGASGVGCGCGAGLVYADRVQRGRLRPGAKLYHQAEHGVVWAVTTKEVTIEYDGDVDAGRVRLMNLPGISFEIPCKEHLGTLHLSAYVKKSEITDL